MHSFVEQSPEKQQISLYPQLRDVVREHLEEYAFLSMMRHNALFDPEISRSQLKKIEARLAAHWDGLVVGSPMTLDVARKKIEEAGDHWDTYTALKVWFEIGRSTTDELANALLKVDDEGLPPWREALCRCAQERVKELVPISLLAHAAPSIQGTALFALGWHNLLQAGQSELFVRHANPHLRYCLARTLSWGAFPANETDNVLAVLLFDEDPIVRRAALWSAAMVNPAAAAVNCRYALQRGEQDPFIAQTLGFIGTAGDAALLLEKAGDESLKGAAYAALGNIGAPHILEELLRHLDDETRSAHAAHAIKKILGKQAQPLLALAGLEDRQNAWRQLQGNSAGGAKLFHGFSVPWTQESSAEPLAAYWRRKILEPVSADNWMKKEIPSDFFAMTGDTSPILGM